ncbi:MAG: hypothetical protein KAJ66_01085 [Candidatus Omnitrophica bacterium]|nr:hypothetical protein [Candidatus Omnitrophota bacterium]
MKKTKVSQKIRYEVDELNRLVLSRPFALTSPLRKKRVVKGYFKADKNKLSYYISSKDKEAGDGLSCRKITFSGRWNFDKKHNLKLVLDSSSNQVFGDTLSLTGEIVKVDARGLNFRLRRRITPGKKQLNDIRLRGFWQADKSNRLVLMIRREKEEGSTLGKLVFEGGWQVNGNNQLIYCFVRKNLKTKINETKTLIFKGNWQIKGSKLVYQLKGFKKSAFTFRACMKTPNQRAAEGKLRYQVGIEYRTAADRKKRITRDIEFFGKWKVSRDLLLAFQLNQRSGRYKSFIFESTFFFNKNNDLTFKVKDSVSKGGGFEVCFKKRFIKNGELFLRLKKEKSGKWIEGAVRFPF